MIWRSRQVKKGGPAVLPGPFFFASSLSATAFDALRQKKAAPEGAAQVTVSI
jgi:hypothetical protein